MLNLCCLDRKPFAAILAGSKRTERRWRSRPDSRLESIEAGESILLMERGSTRALSATIAHSMRFDFSDGHLYCIRLRAVRLVTSERRHNQGWLRVA